MRVEGGVEVMVAVGRKDVVGKETVRAVDSGVPEREGRLLVSVEEADDVVGESVVELATSVDEVLLTTEVVKVRGV